MGLFGSVTDKLFKAAGAGDAASVAKYAGRGADVNACNAYGRTPLTVAVFRPDAEALVLATVTALLARGANVNQSDSSANTALILASWKGYAKVVEKLLAAGAHLDTASRERNTALIWASMLGHVGIVRQLLDAGASVDCTGPGGKTPLHFAAAKGHSEIVQLLLTAGADPLALSDTGRSAITSAERASHPRVAQLLRTSSSLTSSFRSTMSLTEMTMEMTPSAPLLEEDLEAVEVVATKTVNLAKELLDAASTGDLERVTRCLADEADVNTKNAVGSTPLMLAARGGHVDVVEALLMAEALLDKVDRDGNTALIYAASEGHVGIVAVLLVAGVDVDQVNQRGETAATSAIARDHVDVVRELVAYDTSLVGSDSFHPSLLHCAAASHTGAPQALKYLIEERSVDVNAVDGNGVSVLQVAVATDRDEAVSALLGYGARVDHKSLKAAGSPRMQAMLLRHNHALYNERCVELLHRQDPAPTIADLESLVPLITSVYDVRWLLTLVALCPSDARRSDLLHAAFDHILAMKLVFDTPACAYFKMMLESCTEAQFLPRLDVLSFDRQAENINTESAEWVTELKRNVQENAWRLDAHEQCLRQVVDGVHEVHAMVLENRRAVQTTMGQLDVVQAQIVAARQLHAQLARNTSQVVEQLHRRLEMCEENVVHVATSLQSFRDAVVERQEHEERMRKIKMICSVVASVAGFVLAPVVKEIADAVVDLTNPLEIVQYVYGETDIARFLADQSSKHLPAKVQEQLEAFEITTCEFEALLREEIALKHPEYIAECGANKWNLDHLDGGRAETARAVAPALEKERAVLLEITAELRVAMRVVEAQPATEQRWRSPSVDLDLNDATRKAYMNSEAPDARPQDDTTIDETGTANQRELVVFVDDADAFPYQAAVQECGGDVAVFRRSIEGLAEDEAADPNAEMNMRLCAVATRREALCAAQYAYCLGHRDVGDLLAQRMDPPPAFSTTAAAMAVEIVGETDHVPYIDFIHESQGDAARCEHYLALVDEDEHPLDATVDADVVRVLRSSGVAWTAVQLASQLGHVDVVKWLIQKHGKHLPVKERMQLLNHALAQRTAGRVAAHAG